MSERSEREDPPPFLGSWQRVYAAIVIYLAAIVAALWFFARSFAP